MKKERNVYLKMKTLEQARNIILSKFTAQTALATEIIPVQDAVGRILSRPVTAELSSPHFHAAAMDGIAVRASSTFGANPGRILLHVFGSTDVIGRRAAEFLREKLKQEWTKQNREELQRLVDEIGAGWPRAKLSEILSKLDAASGS